jgi:hypothetical protein
VHPGCIRFNAVLPVTELPESGRDLPLIFALRLGLLSTPDGTHNRPDLHVVGRIYAAVRNLQVVECARSPQTEKAGVGGSTPSLATMILKGLAAESRNFQPTIQPMILTELGL